MIAVAVALALTWKAAAFALGGVVLFMLGFGAIDHVGEGPNYSRRENAWGWGGLFVGAAGIGVLVAALAMVLP